MAGAARKSRTKSSKRGSASAFNARRAKSAWRAFGFEPISSATYRKRQFKAVRKAAQQHRSDAALDGRIHRRIATYRDRDPERYRSVYDVPTDESSHDYVGGMDDSSSDNHPDEAAKEAAAYRKELKQRLRSAQVDAAYFEARLAAATGTKGDAIDLASGPGPDDNLPRKTAPSPDTPSPIPETSAGKGEGTQAGTGTASGAKLETPSPPASATSMTSGEAQTAALFDSPPLGGSEGGGSEPKPKAPESEQPAKGPDVLTTAETKPPGDGGHQPKTPASRRGDAADECTRLMRMALQLRRTDSDGMLRLMMDTDELDDVWACNTQYHMDRAQWQDVLRRCRDLLPTAAMLLRERLQMLVGNFSPSPGGVPPVGRRTQPPDKGRSSTRPPESDQHAAYASRGVGAPKPKPIWRGEDERKYYCPNETPGEEDDYYRPGSGGITHPDPEYAYGKKASELARRFRPPMRLEERTVTFQGETWVVDNYDPRIDVRHRVMADGTISYDPAWWPRTVNSSRFYGTGQYAPRPKNGVEPPLEAYRTWEGVPKHRQPAVTPKMRRDAHDAYLDEYNGIVDM